MEKAAATPDGRPSHGRQMALLVALLTSGSPLAWAGPLHDYVQQPDPTYSWKQTAQTTRGGFTFTHLEFQSQTWREHPWTHHLQIVHPPKVRNPETAFLFITGDGDGKRSLDLLTQIASRAGVIAAVVTRIPNQPLYEGRKEDALIAFTIDRYLQTGDKTWPLLFPMVKSAVRAMDTVARFSGQQYDRQITNFVVAGASKRGWTTWLTAAADPRVKAIAPMVIDMLNMKEQTAWAAKMYGKQSEKIEDYTDLNLVERIDDPRMVEVRSWIDPYAYRENYTLPKLLLLGTNDPYWVVDSLRHYWDALPGPKLIHQTPNAGHNLDGGKEATQTLAAFVQMIADHEPLPRVNWTLSNSNEASISVHVDRQVEGIQLWTAESRDRDFRDEKWVSRKLKVNPGSSIASATIPTPEGGYRAYLGEVILKSSTGHDYKLSTEARVTPDGLRP